MPRLLLAENPLLGTARRWPGGMLPAIAAALPSVLSASMTQTWSIPACATAWSTTGRRSSPALWTTMITSTSGLAGWLMGLILPDFIAARRTV